MVEDSQDSTMEQGYENRQDFKNKLVKILSDTGKKIE